VFPQSGRLAPEDDLPRVLRSKPSSKSPYLDESYAGEETSLTPLFLIPVGKSMTVLKEVDGFYLVDAELGGKRGGATRGWLRATSVELSEPAPLQPAPSTAAVAGVPVAAPVAAPLVAARVVLADGEYIPREIMASRSKGKRTEYLVAWEGWPDPKDNTWQSKTSIAGTKAFQAYLRSLDAA
jgi:hypothetical protein